MDKAFKERSKAGPCRENELAAPREALGWRAPTTPQWEDRADCRWPAACSGWHTN
jgi:hypothetical protein